MSSAMAVHTQFVIHTPVQTRSTRQHNRPAAISGLNPGSSCARQTSQSQSLEQHRRRLSCMGAQSTSTDVEATVDLSDEPAAGAMQADGEQRFTVNLRKPMGMVLAERSDGKVFVESITEGGNAAEQGSVQVNDVVCKTSAYVLKEGKSGEYAKRGHGARPFEDYVPIMFSCDGEDFKTVMAAIASNNERWGIFNVELELSRSAA